MKKYFYLFTFAIIILLISANSAISKVPRNVLVEEFTSQGCGWCLRGIENGDELQFLYKDKFILIAMHTSDLITTSLPDKIITKFESVDDMVGEPNSILNRHINGGSLYYDPDDWSYFVPYYLTDSSIVDVNVSYEIDHSTYILTATVTATFTEDCSDQLAFNLYVMEDNIVGEQNNAYSNDDAYKDSPFYYEPRPVPNFRHQNVLRDMVGGIDGITGSFLKTIKAGETYSQTFTTDLKQYKVQDIRNVWVAGIVEQTGSKYEILNAKEAGKIYPKKSYKVYTKSTTNYLTAKRNSTIQIPLLYKNLSDENLNVHFELSPENSDMPDDWSINTDSADVTFDKYGEKTIPVDFHIGSTPAYAKIVFKSKVIDGENYNGDENFAAFYILSDGVEYCIYDFNYGGLEPLKESIAALPEYGKNTVVIPFNPDNYDIFKDYPFKLMMMPGSYNSSAWLCYDTTAIKLMTHCIQSNIPLLITSTSSLYESMGNDPYYHYEQSFTDICRDSLGISGFKGSGYYLGANAEVGIKGSDDPLCASFNFLLTHKYSDDYPYGSYFADIINILDTQRTKPLLLFTADSLNKSGKNIAAVKIDNGQTRNIFMGFSFDLIKELKTRTDLLSNELSWIFDKPVKGWTTDVSKLDFGLSAKYAKKSIVVKNETNHRIKIISVFLAGNDADMFKLDDNSPTSFYLDTGQSKTITVEFIPEDTAIDYNARLLIHSNDNNPASFTIPLHGKYKGNLGVQFEPAINGVFEMDVNPNPAQNEAALYYTLYGANAKPAKIYIVDILGSKVAELFNGRLSPGTNRFEINTREMIPGTYFILAEIGGLGVYKAINVIK